MTQTPHPKHTADVIGCLAIANKVTSAIGANVEVMEAERRGDIETLLGLGIDRNAVKTAKAFLAAKKQDRVMAYADALLEHMPEPKRSIYADCFKLRTREDGVEVLDGDQTFVCYVSIGYAGCPTDADEVVVKDGTTVGQAVRELDQAADIMLSNSPVEHGWAPKAEWGEGE